MFPSMHVPFGFKEWLRGPTTPGSSYLARFRAGCPPIGEELCRRDRATDEAEDDGVSDKCPTCTDTRETRAHFLLECPTYSTARQEMLDALQQLVSQEDWTAAMKLAPERRTLWLLSGCRSIPALGLQFNGHGTACSWESACCKSVAKYLSTSLKVRYASVYPDEDDGSPWLPGSEDSSDEDSDTAFLQSSKHQLAGSMASATARN